MYEAEVAREQAKAEELRNGGAAAHDVKHQDNVLAESMMMIPDCRQRLENALADLQSLLGNADEDKEEAVLASEEYANAQALVKEVEPLFE